MQGDCERTHGPLAAPRFLWPSLGRPEFLGPGNLSFRAVIGARAGCLDAADLASGFFLTFVPDSGRRVDLASTLLSDGFSLPDGAPLKKVLGPARLYSLYEVRLTVPAEALDEAAGDRRTGLFTLGHPRVSDSFHSIAWLRHGWERFRFAFVADTHLSRAWEGIEADGRTLASSAGHAGLIPSDRLKRFFSREAFAASFVNPNRMWRRFVAEANALGRRGELDLVILGGDLVDFLEPGNVEHFVALTTGRAPGSLALEVPLLTVPGNHDYRRFGYRPQIYPLDRWGLHDLQRDHFFREVRGEGRARLSPRDFRAVFARGPGRHPLTDYFLHVSPATDEVLMAGRSVFILLDTGPDVFRTLPRVEPRRWANYLRTIPYAWRHPASAGLTDAQAATLAAATAAAGARSVFIVFHAGLGGARLETRPHTNPATPVAEGGELAAGRRGAVAVERAVLRSALGPGGIFRNHAGLLRAAAAGDRSVLGLSGHMHRSFRLRLDKQSGGLFVEQDGSPIPSPGSFERSSYFVSGPSLGHVSPRAEPPERPGYLSVAVADGRIVSVTTERLRDSSQCTSRFRVRCSPGNRRCRLVRVDLESPTGGLLGVDVSFLVFSMPRRSAPGGFPYVIEPEAPGAAPGADPAWIDKEDCRTLLGTARRAYLQTFRCGPGIGWAFRVAPAVRPALRARAAVVIEALIPGAEAPGTASIWWHPLWVAF